MRRFSEPQQQLRRTGSLRACAIDFPARADAGPGSGPSTSHGGVPETAIDGGAAPAAGRCTASPTVRLLLSYVNGLDLMADLPASEERGSTGARRYNSARLDRPCSRREATRPMRSNAITGGRPAR